MSFMLKITFCLIGLVIIYGMATTLIQEHAHKSIALVPAIVMIVWWLVAVCYVASTMFKRSR